MEMLIFFLYIYTLYAEAAVSLKQIRAHVSVNVKMQIVPNLLKHMENQATIHVISKNIQKNEWYSH